MSPDLVTFSAVYGEVHRRSLDHCPIVKGIQESEPEDGLIKCHDEYVLKKLQSISWIFSQWFLRWLEISITFCQSWFWTSSDLSVPGFKVAVNGLNGVNFSRFCMGFQKIGPLWLIQNVRDRDWGWYREWGWYNRKQWFLVPVLDQCEHFS